RPRAVDVAVEDRRLDAARAVGLHPAEAAEGIAVELLAEVLDHVVALGLAVHEDVQPQRFLLAHDAGDLVAHGGPVGRNSLQAASRLAAGAAELRRWP